MRKAAILLILSIVITTVQGQNDNPKYDKGLAEKLGADDYGMKSYILVMLTTGDNISEDKEQRSKSFTGHMANIKHLVDEEKLVLAGPFMDNERNYRGLFILDVDNLEEAKSILDSDPAIKEKYLAYELYPWYGSAALPEYLVASDKIWKIKP